MLTVISSLTNKLIKETKLLKNKSKRTEAGLYLAEGENVVQEAIMYKPDDIKCIFLTEKFKDRIDNEIFDVYLVPDYIMESLSDTKSPQGITAIMRYPENFVSFEDTDIAVYLDNVSDPGNVGTIIRTADAAGINTVILSPECADVLSPKVIRSTMGSCFHINIVKESQHLDYLKEFIKNNFVAIAGELNATNFHYDVDLRSKVVICLGNEAHGLSDELLNCKGVLPVKIPIHGKAESLNVAIAGAILMYEALRQRGV